LGVDTEIKTRESSNNKEETGENSGKFLNRVHKFNP
jgi:hypothetical protein